MLVAHSQFSDPVFSNPRSFSCTNITKSNTPDSDTNCHWLTFLFRSVTLTVRLMNSPRPWQIHAQICLHLTELGSSPFPSPFKSLPKRITTPFRRWALCTRTWEHALSPSLSPDYLQCISAALCPAPCSPSSHCHCSDTPLKQHREKEHTHHHIFSLIFCLPFRASVPLGF